LLFALFFFWVTTSNQPSPSFIPLYTSTLSLSLSLHVIKYFLSDNQIFIWSETVKDSESFLLKLVFWKFVLFHKLV
jgi:hypothetical protein